MRRSPSTVFKLLAMDEPPHSAHKATRDSLASSLRYKGGWKELVKAFEAGDPKAGYDERITVTDDRTGAELLDQRIADLAAEADRLGISRWELMGRMIVANKAAAGSTPPSDGPSEPLYGAIKQGGKVRRVRIDGGGSGPAANPKPRGRGKRPD